MLKKFYANNTHEVGIQTVSNKSTIISQKLGFDWHYSIQSNDLLRTNLKRILFKYPSSALSFDVSEFQNLEKRL